MNGNDRPAKTRDAHGGLAEERGIARVTGAARYRLIRSGYPALMPLKAGRLRERRRLAVDAEFKRAKYRHHGGRAIAIFGSREFKRLGTIDEKAASNTALILNHPVSPAVQADHKK